MPRWTEDELKILDEIFASPLKFRELAHRLPNKTIVNIQQTGRNRGLKKAQRLSARQTILDLLADGIGRTTLQISVESGVQKSFCKDLMAALTKTGEVHIADWSEKHLAAVYKLGQGKTPTKKQSKTRRAMAHRRLAKIRKLEGNLDNVDDAVLDEAYRLKPERYPTIDPVIVSSINAMVHAGRAAA